MCLSKMTLLTGACKAPERRLSQWCVNNLPGVSLQSQHAQLNNSTSEGMVNKCLSSTVQNHQHLFLVFNELAQYEIIYDI